MTEVQGWRSRETVNPSSEMGVKSMNQCKHEHVNEVPGSVRCYSGSVAVHPYTDENPCAHGNITCTEECCACGAQRSVNINQRHVEFGPFGLTRAERQARDADAQRASEKLRRAKEDAAVKSHSAKVIDAIEVSGEKQVLLEVNGRRSWHWRYAITEAADQVDNGDGLVPFYRGLLRAIDAHSSVHRSY